MKRLGVSTTIFLFVLTFLSTTTWAADLYVSVNGNDADTCELMRNPCRSIQYAIDVSHEGDVINVNTGKYFENIDFIGKAITVKSANGAKRTIIDGGDRTTVVKFNNGETNSSVLDGFTIQNGYAKGANCYLGGGITINSSSPTIKNCIIRWNTADTSGGGIFIFTLARPVIKNCEIVSNFGETGSGIYSGDFSFLKIIDCDIRGNRSKTGSVRSGAAVFFESTQASITGCTIRGNDGGGIAAGNSNLSVINCTVTGNKTDGWGGGILSSASDIDLINSTVSGNRADWHGGGIWIGKERQNNMSIVNSIIWNNSAKKGGNEIYDADVSDNDISLAFSDINQQWLHGVGNMRQNPEFRSPRGPESAPDVGGDYHITAGSPCIDKGTSNKNTYPKLPSRDRDGDIRPLGFGYDMGSDEY